MTAGSKTLTRLQLMGFAADRRVHEQVSRLPPQRSWYLDSCNAGVQRESIVGRLGRAFSQRKRI